jgi:hypothetical protein
VYCLVSPSTAIIMTLEPTGSLLVFSDERSPRVPAAGSTCERQGMTALAWVLIVAIPLTAVGTLALAGRRGRPRPLQGWSTSQLQDRLVQLRGPVGPDGSAGSAGPDRRQVELELFRRGQGHRDPSG